MSPLPRERRFQQIDVFAGGEGDGEGAKEVAVAPHPNPLPELTSDSIRESLSGRGGKRMPHPVYEIGNLFRTRC
jgi:hypothetical protein